nr:hypothetical protein [Tanacetum cinerariifolium]
SGILLRQKPSMEKDRYMPSTITSAIICLATNQKFNFSKWIFDSMGSAILTDPQNTPTLLQPSISQPQNTQKHKKPKRKDTQVPQLSGPTESVADEAVYKELDDSLVRDATTASSLEVEQDSGNINKTQSKETPNESSSQGTDSGDGPRCQDTIGDTIAQTRSKRVSKFFNDSLLTRDKTTQENEIDSLKRKVKKLEKKQRSRTYKLKRLYKVGLTARVESSNDEPSLDEDASKQGRISDIDADEGITLVSTYDDAEMFDHDRDLHEKRRKFFSAKRAEEKMNKPPTQAQQRKIMYTYLKNVEGKKLTDLKNKSFDSIQKMFDRAFKRVNTFIDFRTEEDVETLWKLVKAKHGSPRPEEGYERVLWDDLQKNILSSYYCQYKEVTAAQDEVSVAQELERNILSTYYC